MKNEKETPIRYTPAQVDGADHSAHRIVTLSILVLLAVIFLAIEWP